MTTTRTVLGRTSPAPKATDHRPSARLYNCTRWREASKAYLYKHPLCVMCTAQGRVTTSTETDHITPHRGDEKLFWSPTNWQALCKRCHSIKTAGETRAITRTPTIVHKPRCSVVLVCGAPGSGRMEYAQGKCFDAIVDSSANADGGRHEHQSQAHCTYAWLQFIQGVEHLATLDASKTACVVLSAPTWAERRHWITQLHASACVVLHCAVDRIPADLQPLAAEWHRRYTAGIEEQTIYKT